MGGLGLAGVRADETVASVFGSAFGNLGSLTLAQALGTGGGGIDALLRHSVAAVLNAANTNVDYPLTTSQIVSGVQAAVAGGNASIEQLKNQFDTYNNYGANLDQHGTWCDRERVGAARIAAAPTLVESRRLPAHSTIVISRTWATWFGSQSMLMVPLPWTFRS